MEGKLFVIEGIDGSGKSTQLKLTCDALKNAGVRFQTVTFPQYEEDSSMLLRMYLSGKFGDNPNDVNAYAASTFFAMDRYASYKMKWGTAYENGTIFLLDRYTTSNAVHQAAKLEGQQRLDFLDWLFDFEYRLLGLPKPECVFFLDVPTEFSLKLLNVRQGEKGDIHELDHEYLAHCRENAVDICRRYGWETIQCVDGGEFRKATEINRDICKLIFNRLGVE